MDSYKYEESVLLQLHLMVESLLQAWTPLQVSKMWDRPISACMPSPLSWAERRAVLYLGLKHSPSFEDNSENKYLSVQ